MTSMGISSSGLIYTTVTRRTQVEMYAQGLYTETYKNVVPGMVLDSGITQFTPEIPQDGPI